jgi:hypothetical protein
MGLSFQQVDDFQDGIHVIFAVIVIEEDIVSLMVFQAGLPSVIFQEVGDAENGVGIVEQVDLPVAVAVFAVDQDVAGHELRNSHGAGIRSGHCGRVDVIPLSVSQKSLEFIIGPFGFPMGFVVVFGAVGAGFRGQLFPDVFPRRGIGEDRHGGKRIENRALAHVGAEMSFDKHDGGDDTGIDTVIFSCTPQDALMLVHIFFGCVDIIGMRQFIVIQGGLVVLEVSRHTLRFEEDRFIVVEPLDAAGIEAVGDEPFLEAAIKGSGRVLCRGRIAKWKEAGQEYRQDRPMSIGIGYFDHVEHSYRRIAAKRLLLFIEPSVRLLGPP